MAIHGQCEGCAFKKGGEANLEIYNRFRAEVCAMSGVPFWCHHGLTRQSLQDGNPGGQKLIICSGWRKAVTKYVKPGRANQEARRRKWLKGQAILQLIERFIQSKGNRKKRAKERLSAAVLAFHADDGFTERKA